MSEVADLRDGLLTEEASLRHVDRAAPARPRPAGTRRRSRRPSGERRERSATARRPRLVHREVAPRSAARVAASLGEGATISLVAPGTNGRRPRASAVASCRRHRRGQDVRASRRDDPPGRSPAGGGTPRLGARDPQSARIRPVGVSSSERTRRPGPERRDVGGEEVVEPRRASAPATCSSRSEERSTKARPSSSAATCSQGSVVAVAMVLGGLSQPWTSRRRPSPGPCWSRTTTRRASAGSSARSRRSWRSCRPTGCRCWRPRGRAPRHSTRPRPTVVREPSSFLWPTPAFAARLDEVVAALGVEVVLFGDAFPLALLGPRLARGEPRTWSAAHGFEYWLSVMPGAHTPDALHDVGGLARAGDVQRVHRADRAHRRAGGGAGLGAVPGRGPARRSVPTCRPTTSASGYGVGDVRWSCA